MLNQFSAMAVSPFFIFTVILAFVYIIIFRKDKGWMAMIGKWIALLYMVLYIFCIFSFLITSL